MPDSATDEIDVVTLAVDGMDPTLLDRWIDAGELPNLAALRSNGAYGTAHCSSTSSATQWTTHFTGVGPEIHGVDGFLTTNEKRRAGDRAPDASELVNLSNIGVQTYPELLARAGTHVGLVNPLPLWPPLELDGGFCISGMLTPPNSDRWVSPPGLESELEACDYRIDVRYGDRPYGFVDDDLFDEVTLDRLYDDMFAVLDARIAFTKRAVTDHELNYLYVLLKAIDVIQHCFWAHMDQDDPTYGDAILDAYRRVDNLVGWLEEHLTADILVFSDHGFERRRSDPPTGLHKVATSFSSLVPVPEIAKELYQKTTQRPMTTSNGSSVNSTTGVHSNPAVWILGGPDVSPKAEFDIDFEDIPPTILALLGRPIPEAYIGEPISAIESDIATEPRSLSIRRDLFISDDEVVSDRLHNLGYAEMVDDK